MCCRISRRTKCRFVEKLVDAVAETIPLLLGGAPDAFMSEVARLCPAPEPGVPGTDGMSTEAAMTSREDRLDRLLLAQEIAEFLYREADLLDERRYQDWLALLADDIRYWMPMRRNVKYGEDEREFTRSRSDINWFDEGKETLARRVKQIETGIHWAEEPVSRISHLVSNVQIVEAAPSVAERARGRGQMPLSDLPQPGRDRDRHPGRQARGSAAAETATTGASRGARSSSTRTCC